MSTLLNPTRAARIKSTGKVVYVYALLLGGWCDTADYQTSYTDEQLEILN
jgi:hypothetical protein